MKHILLSLTALLSFGLAETKDVSVEEAKALLAQEPAPLVIDIRTPAEFEKGHIEGAMLIDYKSEAFQVMLEGLDKEQPYLIHCKSGGRSQKSLKTWKELGFKKIYHLTAGYDGWKK